MTIEYPDYYNKFRCIADRCPDTCCAGWEVDLDEESWYRYQVARGRLHEKLQEYLIEEDGWRYLRLTKDGRCPFLKDDNLCELYEVCGEDFLSVTCQEHPRYFIDCGDYEQRDMSLGCPEVARILFEEEGEKIAYIREEIEDGEDDGEANEPYAGADGDAAGNAADIETEGDEAAGESAANQDSTEAGAANEDAEDATDEENLDEESLDEENFVDTALRDRILARRDQILRILQDAGSLEDRMRRTGVWQPVDARQLREIATQMEPLNDAWKNCVDTMFPEDKVTRTNTTHTAADATMISESFEATENPEPEMGTAAQFPETEQNLQAQPAIPEEWLTKFACYLVFRYWIDAYYEKQEGATDGIGDRQIRIHRECAGDIASAIDDSREIRLLNRSIALVQRMFAVKMTENSSNSDGANNALLQSMIQAASLFSREVEFNEGNLMRMKN